MVHWGGGVGVGGTVDRAVTSNPRVDSCSNQVIGNSFDNLSILCWEVVHKYDPSLEDREMRLLWGKVRMI